MHAQDHTRRQGRRTGGQRGRKGEDGVSQSDGLGGPELLGVPVLGDLGHEDLLHLVGLIRHVGLERRGCLLEALAKKHVDLSHLGWREGGHGQAGYATMAGGLAGGLASGLIKGILGVVH
jgi:hypothetical protein